MLFALAFLLSLPLAADPLRIDVVLSEEGGAYRSFADALRNTLPADKYQLNIHRLEEKSEPASLSVAVGMKSALELAGKDTPVLNVLVPKAGVEKLPKLAGNSARLHSGIYLDQPLERQVALLKAVLPNVSNVGVLYSAQPPELPVLKRLLADRNIRLHSVMVGANVSLNDALESVLKESEALFVLADQEVYNAGTIRNILLSAYRKQVPLIGISQAYVRAGSLCAIYSTPEQLALQLAEEIRIFADTGRMSAYQYPSSFEISVNDQVGRSLEIPLKSVRKLTDEIRGMP